MAPNLSSVIIELPDTLANDVLCCSKSIFKSEDLVEQLPRPHVTVIYGITTDDIELIASQIGTFYEADCSLGEMGIFIADSQRDSDVVKLSVNYLTGVFSSMRQRLLKLDNVQTYKNYSPHLTLAYVKPTFGMQYVDDHELSGANFEVGSVVIRNSKKESARLYGCGELYKF